MSHDHHGRRRTAPPVHGFGADRPALIAVLWRRSRRNYRLRASAVLMALSVGTLAVLGSSQLVRGQEAATNVVIRDPAAALQAPDAAPAAVAVSPAVAAAGHRPALPFAPSRPTIGVPQAPLHVKLGPAAGARAVFLGDSYATGWNGAGLGSRGWPALVSQARGWRAVNLAVAGTGFINPGWTNQPIAARVSEAIRLKPDIVFLAAGHNDSRWSAAATAREADEVIDRLRAALPDAMLVIVAPIWSNASPPLRCIALRDHLRRKAASAGAAFIDPLAERWFAGARQRLIGSDGIHPTDAGHRAMAGWVLADLAGAG